MVNVGVAYNNSGNMRLAELRFKQFKRRLCSFGACCTVKNNPAIVALYKGYIGNIVASDLINTVNNFKKSVKRVKLRVSPKAWVCTVGS